MDNLTTQIANELIAKFDSAAKNEDFPEMSRVVNLICASPNNPFKQEILRKLESRS